MGIKRVRMEEIPKEMKYFGYRESKTEEIPNRRNNIGYEEKKGGNNAQKKNPYTVYGLQLTRNAMKDDNKKMRDKK